MTYNGCIFHLEVVLKEVLLNEATTPGRLAGLVVVDQRSVLLRIRGEFMGVLPDLLHKEVGHVLRDKHAVR